MYKIIISLIISTSIANIACAQSGLSTNTTHDIPGITIVSRAKWWADESLKYSTQPVYQQILKNKAKDAEYISKLRASNSPKLKSIQAKQEKKDIANLYIKNNFPQERYPTQTIGYEMDKTLRRPFSYQKKN